MEQKITDRQRNAANWLAGAFAFVIGYILLDTGVTFFTIIGGILVVMGIILAVQSKKTEKIEIKKGMSASEVEAAMGEPKQIVTFGSKTNYKYDHMNVVLENNQVTDVEF